MKKLVIPLLVSGLGLLIIGASFLFSAKGSGSLDIDIVKTATLMPAAHNVYANEEALDGKYYLFKAKITNTSKSTLEDVTVRYRIPGYIEWTELDVIGEMFSGQTASVRCYPKFPESIAEKMTESSEKAEIEISWDGASEDDMIEEEFGFRISSRGEYMFTNIPASEIAGWADVYNNDALLACYVTPNDPIVQYYTQNIQEKILMGEAASVTKDPNEAIRFLTGIYNATILSHMVYSGTKGIPESLQDVSKFSQKNRLPREVITGNTGLCLELSLLYASVLSNAGLDPIIFLVPGHAYPGFKLNGQYYAIEATGIGGEGLGKIMSADEAFQTGQKELSEFIKMWQNGDPRYTMVDIHEVNQEGVTPMALKDDAFLRKKVDDIVGSWSAAGTTTLVGNNGTQNTRLVSNTSGGNSSGASSSSGGRALSLAIPQGWQTLMRPAPQIPILTAQASSPDQSMSISVYDVPANNGAEAMNAISSTLYNYGMSVEFQMDGSTVYGNTYSNEGTYTWVAKTLRKNGGIRVVAIGSPDYLFQSNSGTINQLFNSIR
ncbi:MAG: hypothetical protein AAF489_10750 [Bacteroidota bacterium]